MELQTTWYQELLEDLKKIECYGVLASKWLKGARIVVDEFKFNKPEWGSFRVENIARDNNEPASDIWACIRFYKKYPIAFSTIGRESYGLIYPKLLESKFENKSWHYVRQTELYETRPPKQNLKLPPGKYSAIYADPPWEYYEGGYKNQSQHYNTYTVEELKQMPIDDLAADNCVLFLWVTFPILNEVFDLIKWWGFEYSTVGFVWVKSLKDGTGFNFGLGNWTRANAELCLIAHKGSIERKDASISQIIYEPVGEHSAKPAIVRDKIVQLVGDIPRIELFARTKTEGWDVWGNEV